MLKTRVIPVLTIKDLKLVKSIQFFDHRNIGSYIAAVRVFNLRDVDELIFLDLDAGKTGIKKELLSEITKECFMPLTIGGGVKSLKGIRELLSIGADKVAINSEALRRPDFINEASRQFGSQCVVVSIDAKKIGDEYFAFGANGSFNSGMRVSDWVVEAERRGAGEILLTSIDKDGTMEGYDVELAKRVADIVRIPVIAAGGAGNLEHFSSVIIGSGVSAAGAASIFQYTQITPMNVKRHLSESGIPVRI